MFLIHRMLLYPMALLLCINGVAVFGQNEVELPQEVTAGWRRLAEQSKTYRVLFTQERRDGRTTIPIVMSRLDNKYVKYENLKDGTHTQSNEGEVKDFAVDIESVFLFDGSEYFSLYKPSSSSKYTLGGVGLKSPMEQLRPNTVIGPEIDAFGLLGLADSQSKVQSFEGDETGCRLTYIDDRNKDQRKIMHVELDPRHDYRVISVVSELPTFRSRQQFHYEDHPAIPSRIDRSPDKPDAPIAGTEFRWLLPDQRITRDQFQLEYYGLPAFRKRSQSYWQLIAVAAVASVLLIGGLLWWKRKSGTV